MKAFAVAISLILGAACGASGESLTGCVNIERGCSWLEDPSSSFVSLQGQFKLPSCPVGWRLQVEGHYVGKPAHSPDACSIADFSKHFEVASLSCVSGPAVCNSRATLERWIIDNQVYLNNCLNQEVQRRKDDYYDGAWCDGKPADVLDDKLKNLLLRDETPSVRRFDDDMKDHHIVCVRNRDKFTHCNFTSNMLQ